MIERSEKIYNTSEYHHLSQKNPHLSIKLEKHGISLPFITPAKVSQAHLWYLHSLITSCETFPPMCRNTPGVSLLLQDGRTERDGWGGDSHPCQGSSAFTLTHTHTKEQKDLQLFTTGQILLQMWILQMPTRLSDEVFEFCFIPSVPKTRSLTGRKFLSSQDQKKERGLHGKSQGMNPQGIHTIG